LQFLDASKASDLAGIKLNKGGLYLPQAGWLKPQAFCKTLTRSRLITKVTSTNALELKKINNRWQALLNNDEALEADIVVICNANDVKQFEQSKNIAITSVRGQVNFFPENPISKQIKTVICSDHYLSPAIDSIHSIGTSYAANDFNANLSDQDTRANLHALRKISSPLFDAIKMQNVTGRVAWRSATKDYLPLAGQLLDDVKMFEIKPRYNAEPKSLPWINGLYINAGHGSKGMITAPLCGELVAILANNEPLSNGSLSLDAAIASTLNPSRFTMRALALKQLASALY
jgi:tRNA 5-methylaminomethyl-2-thiouridine biosynthesis bifunctional protein